MSPVRIGVRVPDLAAETLRFYRQAGAEVAEMPAHYSEEPSRRSPAPLVPTEATARPPQPARAWDAGELMRVRSRLEQFEIDHRSLASGGLACLLQPTDPR